MNDLFSKATFGFLMAQFMPGVIAVNRGILPRYHLLYGLVLRGDKIERVISVLAPVRPSSANK
jgi:hypothetical protein